jgi:hypothetical protein
MEDTPTVLSCGHGLQPDIFARWSVRAFIECASELVSLLEFRASTGTTVNIGVLKLGIHYVGM